MLKSTMWKFALAWAATGRRRRARRPGFGLSPPVVRRLLRTVLMVAVISGGLAHGAHLTAVRARSGPSQTSAVCMAQDHRGFIWIGTQDGLNRFDGYEYKVYSRVNSPGLHDNYISALAVHPDGSLWVGTRQGIDRLDPLTGGFSAVDLSPVGTCNVNAIAVDSEGTAWIGTETHGLLRLPADGSPVDRRAEFADPGSDSVCQRVNAILLHSNGEIWVMTAAAGLHVLDENLKTLRVIASEVRNPETDRPYPLKTAAEDGDRVWVASAGAGLLMLDLADNTLVRQTWDNPRDNNVNTVLLDSGGRLWVGTWGGLTELWPETGRWRHNRPDRADVTRLDDPLVNSLLEDRGGTLWVGTWGAGPYRYNPQSDRFRSYQGISHGAGTGLVDTPVGSMTEDSSGRIWVGLNRQGRVLQFEPESESFALLPSVHHDSARLEVLHAVGEDLFVGWSDGRVERVSTTDNTVINLCERYTVLARELNDPISALRVDHRGWLWIGTRSRGLFAIDLTSAAARHYLPDGDDQEGLAGRGVNDVLPTSDGRVWLATSGGLQRLDPESGRFETFAEARRRRNAVPHNEVTTMLHDSEGRMWIGTQGGGVALMIDDEGVGDFEVVDSSTGLGADAVGLILEGADGGIWASTTRGLSRIDPQSLSVLNYVPADGVLDGGFYIGSGTATSHGKLLFGGFKGMISVDPLFAVESVGQPEVEVTAISINGDPLRGLSSNDGEVLELRHTASNLTFEFTALSTRKPDLIRFAYRLVPFTSDWTEQSADRRFATFFNLPAGSYRFEVMAMEYGGEWSRPTVRRLVKRPPWYQSPPAKLAYWIALAIAAASVGSTLHRKRKKRHEQRRKNELALQDLAYVDQLTRLPNRVQMERRLEELLKEVVENREIHILFVDLDHFKDINDSLGHEIGDRVLTRVARRVSEAIGADALVCRWGGDEFVALLEGQSLTQAEITAQSVIDELARPFVIDSYEFIVTASVGIANASLKGTDSASVLRSAEAALYRAKQLGKSSWCVFDESVGKQTLDRVELERDLREAIAAKDIHVVYQPMFDRSGRIVAAEALSRWQQPNGTEVSASRFIRVAEETGMILDLDRIVLNTVLDHATKLHNRGLLDFRLSINMSGLEFRRRDLADRMLQALDHAKVSPTHIEIEVTEGVLLSELDNATQQIATLRHAGLTVSIDDFGTGFSALSYLTTLQVDRLKIDRSFVSRLDRDKAERAIVTGVIQIAADLGIEVIAEGVENAHQLEILQELSCDVFQGFHLARPMPFDELVARL